MFYLQKAFLNVRRHKMKSFLVVLVCMLIELLLYLFIGGLKANLQQLARLPEAVSVYARVSNLNGTMSSGGILIQENVIDGLIKSPHVTELLYTVQMGSALGQIKEKDVMSMETGDVTFPLSLGVNTLTASPSLSVKNIDFLKGYGPEFLEEDNALCIVRDQDMERNGLSIGDSVWITLFYPTYPKDRYDLTYNWLGVFKVKIVGCYSEMWNSAEDSKPPQIVFPSKWVRNLYKQAGVMFFADSVRFRVADPLSLNEFKGEMKKLHLMPVISQAQHSHRGIALTVNDETFVRAASRLVDNITLMRVFTPFIFVTVGLVGFVMSYLMLQSRKSEIAIMLSLGMSRKNCFTLLFLENAAQNLMGSVIGVLSAALLTEVSVLLTLVVTGIFFACYMAGTMAAMILIGRFSVMTVLSALE
ncbi:FtsX-like permease family protein [Anaerocolumna sp. MB42-C2]|uniref:FtsX-like permease family protein n=1 Tax=Anaerocolumna sp. MB42-C2 TaxID=3070997 RepID=UPI0027E1DCB2|nr:ABC transporter permease [Anaerocolumna sp. MB42-C2]WMJ89121.1 ABC transporter permease [Anaerocolumna sp. MB42-C2]